MKTFIISTGEYRIKLSSALALIFTAIIVQSCGPSEAGKNAKIVDPGFSSYISGYTGGVISVTSAITVQLMQAAPEFTAAGNEVTGKLFDFSPSVGGKATWVDPYTVAFQPDENLKSGTSYDVKFNLGKLLEVPEKYNVLKYSFSTIKQNYSIDIEGVFSADPQDLKKQLIKGTLLTADAADQENIKKILTANQNGNSLAIGWEHSQDQKSHRFVISGVIRASGESGVDLAWNGSPIGVEEEGSQKVIIPSLADFKVVNTRVVHYPQQYVVLQFSDPILDKQDLDGMITMENTGTLHFIIDGNEVRVYPPVNQTGQKTVHINQGIKNILGYSLKKDQAMMVMFEQINPGVRMVGKGVILPGSQGLIMPFEAVNLKAVDVSIIKIYENNITQFLQVNNMDGNYELHRVGYPVVHKMIVLNNTGVTDLGKWNRYTLDLSELMKTDPGAIYQVELGFTKAYSVFYCEGVQPEENSLSTPESPDSWNSASETSNWDDYEDYDYYPQGYNWQERDNPCDVSYYTRDRFVQSNLFASNLGLMAKSGTNGDMMVVVTDLITTEPVSGVNVQLYDFQKQLLESMMTDNKGQATFRLSKKPFLLIASRDKEKGYLKLDDGNSLSLSSFNVGGEKVQEGIKGFIYGERGVWRPGDSLYLNFILEDKNKLLPAAHPVIFELFNPMGQPVQKTVKTTSLNGFYDFSTRTNDDAPTGNWQARVMVGGAVFYKQLKIETIKPNRLKIDLDFGINKLVKGKNTVGNLSVKWLHGGNAGNLKAEFEVSLRKSDTQFENYSGYVFDDPSRSFETETYSIFEGLLDQNGNAKVPVDIQMEKDAPGMLNATIKGKVFEESGDFSVDMFTIPYYPYQSYVGLQTPRGDRTRGMLLTDTTHQIMIATVDADGKGVSRTGVEMEVYKLDWRWWWDSSDADLGNYLSSDYHKPVLRQRINTVNGKGIASFRISYPDWGRYLIRVTDPVSGHSAGNIVYVDWPGWAGRARKESPGGATMLSFTTDKDKYNAGEPISLTIPGSGQGRAFISVENGSSVIETFWMETKQGDNVFKIDATENFSPNVFIYVSLLQPYAQTINDLPIRMYGVIPVIVDNPATHLSPVLAMKDELKPNSDAEVRVSEANGKSMTYTIAVVDEGLLDLTNYRTPDPWSVFYKREGLGVKTWDLFDDVIGAYGGKLERLLSVGGDEEIKSPEGTKANRFKPVVISMGPFHLDKNKSAVHHFKLPPYIGAVKTMIVAAEEGAYGSAEKESYVRQPVMVLVTLPRVLGPSEEVTLPVTVFSYDPKVSRVEVEIKPNEMFELTGNSKTTVNFSQPGDQVVNFNLKVKPRLGVGVVEVSASSGNLRASDRVELNVRNPNPPATKVYEAMLEKGKDWNMNFDNVGMSGTNSAVLEISNIPPINLDRRLNYLIHYPYGCIEQTTSSVFPQLYLTGIVDLNNDMKESISVNIRAGIERIKNFQNNDGGFSYWPDAYTSDEWCTSYAGHFLIEARKKGYTVPEAMIRNWIRFQKRKADSWSHSPVRNSELVQAYRLYTLALAGEGQTGNMNRLREINLPSAAKWMLAAGYQLAGMEDIAKSITGNILQVPEDYNELSNTYGSGFRDQAMMLEALVLMNRRSEGADLMRKLSAALSDNNRWLSTQETSFALIAVSSFAGKEEKSKQVKFEFTWGNDKKISASTELPLIQKQLTVGNEMNGKLRVINTGDGIIYARLIQEGTPAISQDQESSSNLNLIATYKNANGELLDLSRIKQGTEIVAEVSVGNPGLKGDYRELALSQIFPSGFEIVNERLAGEEPADSRGLRPNYIDIRDDRVYTFFDLAGNNRRMFTVKLVATYAGRYYMPGVYCEAMYDNSINARTKGDWVMIIPSVIQ